MTLPNMGAGTKIRILVADGNGPEDRAAIAATNGCPPSEMLGRLLRSARADIEPELFYPTDATARSELPFEDYDGILITGSKSNIYKQEPETLRQIEFAKAAVASGTPMFGVCWGLQLVSVAMGGEVKRAAHSRYEVPFAPDIHLTAAGQSHPLHLGRPEHFDAFAFHSDEVTRLPDGATVTASNRYFIQAAEFKFGQTVFWGVQYHPELSGQDMGGFLRGHVRELAAAGVYNDEIEAGRAADVFSRFAPGALLPTGDRSFFESIDAQSFEFRPLELTNWIEQLVIPSMRRM